MIDISVVIGTRNQASILDKVLASFEDQTFERDRFDIVVVDSESTDDTPAVCDASRRGYALQYLRQPNRGKSSARNAGIDRARGAAIFLTDADVLAPKDVLARQWRAAADYPGAIIVGQQFMVDEPVRESAGGRPCLNPAWARGHQLTWREFVTGNALCPAERLRDVGGFDAGFQHYGYEDYELGYRLAKSTRFVFEPHAVNYHFHPVTFDEDIVRKRGAGRGAVYFAERHPSWPLRWRLGVTPLNRFLYRALAEDGRLVTRCRRWTDRPGGLGRFARQVVLEAAYQAGARHAWRESREAGHR